MDIQMYPVMMDVYEENWGNAITAEKRKGNIVMLIATVMISWRQAL